MWDKVENKRTQADNQHASGNFPKLSVIDAGFKDSKDATQRNILAEHNGEMIQFDTERPNLGALYQTISEESAISLGKRLGLGKTTIENYKKVVDI